MTDPRDEALPVIQSFREERRNASRAIVDLATHTEPHVTLEALAAYLVVHRKTIVKWIHAGHLDAYRFGNVWRVRTSDALAYVNSSKYRISA